MSVITYTCPNCGGHLEFDPESQKIKCESCGSLFTEQQLNETETNQQSESSEDPKMLLYNCPSCGAQIIADENTSATICCYCHNPIVLSKQLSGEFRPSKIIPFKISREKAVEAFLKWKSRYKFLPKDFSSPSQLEKITGLYMPYWLVDASVLGSITARGERIRTWVEGGYKYTRTDIYNILREADMKFESIPHDGSKKADDNVMDSIGPFNFADLKPFSSSYLSGFLAEKYDVASEEVLPIVKPRIEQGSYTALKSTIPYYDHLTITNRQNTFESVDCHYTLLPIWMLTYIYKDKTYIFAMNGQNGKVYGSLPLCKNRLFLFCIAVFILIFIISFIGGILIW